MAEDACKLEIFNATVDIFPLILHANYSENFTFLSKQWNKIPFDLLFRIVSNILLYRKLYCKKYPSLAWQLIQASRTFVSFSVTFRMTSLFVEYDIVRGIFVKFHGRCSRWMVVGDISTLFGRGRASLSLNLFETSRGERIYARTFRGYEPRPRCDTQNLNSILQHTST